MKAPSTLVVSQPHTKAWSRGNAEMVTVGNFPRLLLVPLLHLHHRISNLHTEGSSVIESPAHL
jgi:hypothetical protein